MLELDGHCARFRVPQAHHSRDAHRIPRLHHVRCGCAEIGASSAWLRCAALQDRKQARASSTELCFPFALGRCRFGDDCRFSHDIAAYLAARPADLPGRCPFSAMGACPYGQRASAQPLQVILTADSQWQSAFDQPGWAC